MTAPSDDERFTAVAERDRRADGAFFYAVATTGIYCRPSCGARTAKRENVAFFATADAAEAAGYRACKRCRPRGEDERERARAAVARVCAYIDASSDLPPLAELASVAQLSPHHFHRTFREIVGLTPRRYASARRAQALGETVRRSARITDAAFDGGFGSSSTFYADAERALGMTPSTYRSGGAGETIRLATAETPLGTVVVAATARGICAVRFGDDAGALRAEVAADFPAATLGPSDAEFEAWTSAAIARIAGDSDGRPVPLDLRGSVFARRVWQALLAIPRGERVSYAELARRLGVPRATRAVAGAVGANPVAVIVPCHRVVGTDGSLRGYRWGTERKAELLRRERPGDAAASAAERSTRSAG